ncbi:unnamed protein product [Meloidogyne enterolobii]|uniref:Uncharacterized protein n=1 Tax=Meloidogyne enterolobii TaxID=390850 RepID=A0ACB1B1Y2_MELEN
MRLLNWMVNNFTVNTKKKKSSQNQQIYDNNSSNFLHSSLFLIAQKQHGVINKHPPTKQKHPWETTKRFMRFPLNLMANKGRLRKLSTSSSSSSFSEEVWLRMRANNEQNNIDKTPQKQRSVENRRFTESPKALRRSFRRVRQRGGSVHFSKIKSEEEGKRIVRPNSLNLKLNGNCGEGRNYSIKNERENIDEEQKIEKGKQKLDRKPDISGRTFPDEHITNT